MNAAAARCKIHNLRNGPDRYDVGQAASQLEAILDAWLALDLAAQEFGQEYGPLTLALKRAIEGEV